MSEEIIIKFEQRCFSPGDVKYFFELLETRQKNILTRALPIDIAELEMLLNIKGIILVYFD